MKQAKIPIKKMKRRIIKLDNLTLQSELTIAGNNQGDILTMGLEDLFASKMSQQYSISIQSMLHHPQQRLQSLKINKFKPGVAK
ncbi:unnamed protein product [Rhizophagus irregularis]|nr:unnamed protein product [Rhizophagus irregularis]CAB4445215.1 unnamed protein product [Rhizophagus irregularis]